MTPPSDIPFVDVGDPLAKVVADEWQLYRHAGASWLEDDADRWPIDAYGQHLGTGPWAAVHALLFEHVAELAKYPDTTDDALVVLANPPVAVSLDGPSFPSARIGSIHEVGPYSFSFVRVALLIPASRLDRMRFPRKSIEDRFGAWRWLREPS